MKYAQAISLHLVLLFVCPAVWGQAVPADPQPGSAPAATQPASPEPENIWSAGPINFSGLVDVYYSSNFNHPASRINALRNFDVKANQFSLNMAKLTLEHTADPVGFRVDFGFGRAFETMHASEPADGPNVLRNIEQAYLSVKPKGWKGLQLDFGQYVTSAGAEVIETSSNWNYSRSLLFALAIPYYHFGVRASLPVGQHFSAGVHLANGWNNVEDNNSGKTVGLMAVWSGKLASWTNTYHVGREQPGDLGGLRHLYDTTLLLTPSPKANFYINFDYGADRNPLGPNRRWVGVAGAARFALNSQFAIAPRLEWFNDADGFATGSVQRLKEFTLTGEYKMRQGFLTRLEYRRDWSDRPFFERGAVPGVFKNQDTILLGFVACFGPKR